MKFSEVVDGIAYDVVNPETGGANSDVEMIKELREMVERGYLKICQLASTISSFPNDA